MTTIDNIQNTILPRPFWGVDKGGNFIGFLSFIAINCLIFIVIGDKLKYDKNETYNYDSHIFTFDIRYLQVMDELDIPQITCSMFGF